MEYKITEYFSNTKEIIERAADKSEVAEIKAREKATLEIEAAKQEKQAAREAIAEKLGLTADELAVLLG